MALEVETLAESKFNVIDQIKESQTLEFERIAN